MKINSKKFNYYTTSNPSMKKINANATKTLKES